jgi:hypothetical protein
LQNFFEGAGSFLGAPTFVFGTRPQLLVTSSNQSYENFFAGFAAWKMKAY